MNFQTDKQTFHDLEILNSGKNQQSIFDLFNKTQSLLGKERLCYFLSHPLTDLTEINNRIEAISFFQHLECKEELDIDKNTLDFIEHYLMQGDYPTTPPSKFSALEKAVMQKINPTNQYYIIERGIDYIIYLLNNLYDFSVKIANNDSPQLIAKNNAYIFNLFDQPEFNDLSEIKEMQKLKPISIAKYDYMFRYTYKDTIRNILNIIYDYDVFITVSQVATEKTLSFPEVLPAKNSTFEIDGLYNPFITNPVRNDLSFSTSNNLIFITGPNMAGKSSLLKALAVTAYLAHVGFPVPATMCKISLLAGIYTTINLSDNLNLGYSHFYSEVARIKFIAERLKEYSNMLIVFDELFRGTNIKDAYDGTLAIVSALSKIKNCFLAVSTHIIEVAEYMNETNLDGIQFQQMEMITDENSFQYTYLLKNGISDKRIGMRIIEKEQVIDIIDSITTNQTTK